MIPSFNRYPSSRTLWLLDMYEFPDRESSPLVLLTSPLRYHLDFIKYLCSHSADRTVEIILRLRQPKMTPQVIMV